MPSLFYQFIPMVSTMVSMFFHTEYKLGMKLCVTITHQYLPLGWEVGYFKNLIIMCSLNATLCSKCSYIILLMVTLITELDNMVLNHST